MEIQVLRWDSCDSAPMKKSLARFHVRKTESQGIKLALKSVLVVPGFGDLQVALMRWLGNVIDTGII